MCSTIANDTLLGGAVGQVNSTHMNDTTLGGGANTTAVITRLQGHKNSNDKSNSSCSELSIA